MVSGLPAGSASDCAFGSGAALVSASALMSNSDLTGASVSGAGSASGSLVAAGVSTGSAPPAQVPRQLPVHRWECRTENHRWLRVSTRPRVVALRTVHRPGRRTGIRRSTARVWAGSGWARGRGCRTATRAWSRRERVQEPGFRRATRAWALPGPARARGCRTATRAWSLPGPARARGCRRAIRAWRLGGGGFSRRCVEERRAAAGLGGGADVLGRGDGIGGLGDVAGLGLRPGCHAGRGVGRSGGGRRACGSWLAGRVPISRLTEASSSWATSRTSTSSRAVAVGLLRRSGRRTASPGRTGSRWRSGRRRCATASVVRLMLIRCRCFSSIHIRAPPAPQQNDSLGVARHLGELGAGDDVEQLARRRRRPGCAGRGSTGRGR